MKIPLNINDKELFVDCSPEDYLVTVLRQQQLFSVKDTDTTGKSGSSHILLDGKPVPSCIIPAFAARDCKIITLEYFKTTKEYEIIAEGFKKAGVKFCDICTPSRFFTAYDIIMHAYRPTKKDILPRIEEFTCRCASDEAIATGIRSSAIMYRDILGKEKNGKK